MDVIAARAFSVCQPDAATWDSFVATHAQGHLLQSSPWGTLKSRFGWQPLRVAVANQHGALVAGAQMLRRTAYGASLCYVPRGPLLSGDEQADEALLATLLRLARRQRAVLLRIEPNLAEAAPGAAALHTWLQLRGFVVATPLQPQSSIHTALAGGEEQLLAALSKGHRADIRRAERGGVTVRVGASDDDLRAFYAIMTATGKRADFALHSLDYYRQAWQLLGAAEPAGGSLLLLAAQDGTTIAAFLVLAWGQEACYLYSGSNEAGLKSGANHLLQWHALRWAMARGCTRYDLWGVPDQFGQMAQAPAEERAALEAQAKTDPLYGVYRFKKGFAGQVVRYLPAYDYRVVPWLYGLVLRKLG